MPLINNLLFPAFDRSIAEAARDALAGLAIPSGSLGKLHELAVTIAGITAQRRPVLRSCAAIVFCSDHGIATRGVSGFDQSVTRANTKLIATGKATINAFARAVGARVIAVDVGMTAPLDSLIPDDHVVYLERRVAPGTRDLSLEPAMSHAETTAAMNVGAAVVAELSPAVDTFVLGEMGIGNTTASAALACAIFQLKLDDVLSRGSGSSDIALGQKRASLEAALCRWNAIHDHSPLEALRQMGGFEIAAIVGAIFEAARRRKPILLDGVIVTTAAAVAVRMAPEAAYVLISGTRSADIGQKQVLELLGLSPILDLGMRLGEGTAAVLAWPILRAAALQFTEIQTLDQLGCSSITGKR